MSEVVKPTRLQSIDVLRGVAALAVVVMHIPHEAPGGWREHACFLLSWMADFGYLGVALFVLLSGFCIHRRAALTLATTGRFQVRWASFWARRFMRLYPPYVGAMVLSLAMAAYVHDRYPRPWKDWLWDLGLHLGMVHNLTDTFAGGLTNGAFWSLGMEEQLYLLYALLTVLLVRRGWPVTLLFAAFVTVAWRCAVPWWPARVPLVEPVALGAWHLWPTHFWLHWTLGALAVEASLGVIRLPAWCYARWSVLLAGAVAVVGNLNTWGLIQKTQPGRRWLGEGALEQLPAWLTCHYLSEAAFGLACFFVMNRLIANEHTGAAATAFGRRVSEHLAWVGRISYSLYLTHVPVLYALEDFVPFGSDSISWCARYALYLPSTLVVGWLFFVACEQWFLEPWSTDRVTRLRQALGCWLTERWRAELVLRLPGVARWMGMEWQDLCNRHERLERTAGMPGRKCLWPDSSTLTLGREFPGVGGRLLHAVLCEWPIDLAAIHPKLNTGRSQCAATVILPVGGADRLRQFRLSLASVLSQREIDFEVIVVEHSALPAYESSLPPGVRYQHLAMTSADEAFNKSWAMNVAARLARGEVLVVLDADFLVPCDLLTSVCRMLHEYAYDSLRFGRHIFYTTEEQLSEIEVAKSVASMTSVSIIVQNTPMPVAVRRDAYVAVGGHDESFEGWGGEDVEFVSRLRTLRHSDFGYVPLVHLWHPAAPKKQSGDRNQRQQDAKLAESPAVRIESLRGLGWGTVERKPFCDISQGGGAMAAVEATP